MNGFLHNTDIYSNCLNRYKVTFKDGSYVFTRAKCPSDAEDNVEGWNNKEYDDILEVNEIE